MKFNELCEKARALPRSMLIPGAVMVVILLLLLLRLATHIGRPGASTSVAVPLAKAPTTAVQLTVPPAHTASARDPAVSTHIEVSQPTSSEQPAIASTSPMATQVRPIAPEAVMPPDGLVSGRMHLSTFGFDQFGRQIQLSSQDEIASTPTFKTEAVDSHSLVRAWSWDWWIQLDKPTKVAQILVKGGGGTVAATIDGQQVGPSIHQYGSSTASSQSVMTLATGWHHVQIRADVETGNAGGWTGEIAVGDAMDSLGTPLPWAAPDAVPAFSSSAAKALNGNDSSQGTRQTQEPSK